MKTALKVLLASFAAALAWPALAALNVFACEPEWAALAQELGGDKVSVFSAVTPLQDPHRLEARPSLISRMRGADLVICSGSGARAFPLRGCGDFFAFCLVAGRSLPLAVLTLDAR